MPYGRRGGELVVNTQLAGNQTAPSVAGFRIGRFHRRVVHHRYDAGRRRTGDQGSALRLLRNAGRPGDADQQRGRRRPARAERHHPRLGRLRDHLGNDRHDPGRQRHRDQGPDLRRGRNRCRRRVPGQQPAHRRPDQVLRHRARGRRLRRHLADRRFDPGWPYDRNQGPDVQCGGHRRRRRIPRQYAARSAPNSRRRDQSGRRRIRRHLDLGLGHQRRHLCPGLRRERRQERRPVPGQFARLRYNQDNSSVTELSDGRFVVTWSSSASLASGDVRIRARIFSASGTPIGNEFARQHDANDPDSGLLVSQSTPNVEHLPDGGFRHHLAIHRRRLHQ